MAVFSTSRMTLDEAYRREGYQGYESLIGDLQQENDFLRVASVLPANHGSIHNTLIADKIGKGKVRKMNEGIALLNGKTHEKSEPVVSYEADSEVDEGIIKNSPDPMKTRTSEDSLNFAGFSQGWNELLISGTAAKDGGFEGLQTRRNKLSNPYVINVNDTSPEARTSAYLIEFGENSLTLRYASGAAPGIITRDNGRVKAAAADSNGYFWAWSTHFEMNFGISIRREGALWRLVNADAMGDTIKPLLSGIIRAKNKMPSKGRGAFIFVNADLHSRIEIGMLETATNIRTVEFEGYGPVPMFLNLPIMTMDAISSNETEVA